MVIQQQAQVRSGILVRLLTACVIAGVGLGARAMAQSTVTLNGKSYTLQSHPRIFWNGASGSLTTAMSDTSNRAQSGNPAYAGLVSNVTNYKAQNICSTGANTYSGSNCSGAIVYQTVSLGQFGHVPANAAQLWFAQGGNPADPNGYLAYAKMLIDHPEDLFAGSFACDETSTFCTRDTYDIFNIFSYDFVWATYSLIRSQLSSGEIATFTQKILNDNSTSNHGIGGTAASPTSSCTKQTISNGTGTISSTYGYYPNGNNVVVGVGTSFTTQLAVGDVLIGPASGYGNNFNIGIIYSITDNTHLVLTTPAWQNYSGAAFRFATAWATGNCGGLWYAKHHGAYDGYQTASPSTFSNDYPPIGTGGGSIAQNQQWYVAQQNIAVASDKMGILMGLALADDDSRAKTLLTEAYQPYNDYQIALQEEGFTPFDMGGGAGYFALWWQNEAMVALAIQQSVISPPNLVFPWFKQLMTYAMYMNMRAPVGGAAAYQAAPYWDGSAAPNCGLIQQYAGQGGPMAASYLFDGSATTQAYYNYMRNLRPDYSGGGWATCDGFQLPYLYSFYNYTESSGGQPSNQYVWRNADLTYAQCLTAGYSNCSQNPSPSDSGPPMTWQNAISFSNLTSTGTMAFWRAGWNYQGQDHTTIPEQGGVAIFRNVYLLAGDGGAPESGGGFNLGGPVTDNLIDLNLTMAVQGTTAPFSRWAGTDPTGDASNRYAYAMIDLTNTYCTASGGPCPGPSKAVRVQRHLAHFKKNGAQDYIVQYDDIALSAALPVAPKAYFHYYLNGIAPGTAISYNGSSKTISNGQSSALLNSAFITPAGSTSAALVVDNANGTYTGGNGNTFRAYMCPSSNGSTCDATKTAGEWLGIFQPVNGTSGSMPALTQLTSTSFRTVQIADATSPKVVAFAQGGATYASLSFTSTHAATGQYLIAGLTPGTYNVTVGGNAVSGSPFVVNSGDNTLYFESSSGVVSIAQSGSTLSLSCDLNGDGQVNVQDVQISMSAALGAIGCLSQYQLDGSGSCTIVDVQRVVSAALGLGCKIGL